MARTAEEIKEAKHKQYMEHQKERIEAERKRRIEKKEEIAKTKRKYYVKHRDEILAERKQNREKYSQKEREFRETHKEEVKAREKKRNHSPVKYDSWASKLSPFYPEGYIRRDPDNPEMLQMKCQLESCNNWVTPTLSQVRTRLACIYGSHSGNGYIYCSDECKEKCPAYNRTKYPKGFKVKQDYSRDDQPQLRELVLKRDNYTCQREECGKSLKDNPNLKLVCHHKFPINEDPIGSADIDNCITLCAECHKWVHENIPGCSYTELQCSKKEENQ